MHDIAVSGVRLGIILRCFIAKYYWYRLYWVDLSLDSMSVHPWESHYEPNQRNLMEKLSFWLLTLAQRILLSAALNKQPIDTARPPGLDESTKAI